MTNQVFIQEAYLEALKSPMATNYGAVLVYQNKIISKGHNHYKSNITNSLKCCLL